MTRPETDTSASEPGESTEATTGREDSTTDSDVTTTDSNETTTDPDETTADPDVLFDALVAEGVLTVDESSDSLDESGDSPGEGGVRTTDEFDEVRAVYHDSYVGIPDEEFHEAVAAAFGLPDAESAADGLAARDVSRAEFVRYLAVRSHLDREVPPADLAAMAAMVSTVVPNSPVPPALANVTDDPTSFVAERDRTVVSVWKRFCDPCESLKDDLDPVLDAIPDDVEVAGIDGETDDDFCRIHGVDAAPGFVLVRNEDRRTVTGADADAATAAIRAFFAE